MTIPTYSIEISHGSVIWMLKPLQAKGLELLYGVATKRPIIVAVQSLIAPIGDHSLMPSYFAFDLDRFLDCVAAQKSRYRTRLNPRTASWWNCGLQQKFELAFWAISSVSSAWKTEVGSSVSNPPSTASCWNWLIRRKTLSRTIAVSIFIGVLLTRSTDWIKFSTASGHRLTRFR